MICHNTPIQTHVLWGKPILVKREDLCSPFPGPAFSKMRGVVTHIQKRPEQTIGVLDTYHSQAGWAVAYVCSKLGKRCVNFWPRYKADAPNLLRKPQRMALSMGAHLVALPAGRSSILFHQAKKLLSDDDYLMPNALKLPESMTENAHEAARTFALLPTIGTVIISISSGTVAAGIVRAVPPQTRVILHMGYSRSIEACRTYIEHMAGIPLGSHVRFIDEGYRYADQARYAAPIPFPCNPFYDLKAWGWLSKNLESVTFPVLFWNIGD